MVAQLRKGSWLYRFESCPDYKQLKVMRDFDKEYSDWKKDIYTVLIMGFVLGLIAGILI